MMMLSFFFLFTMFLFFFTWFFFFFTAPEGVFIKPIIFKPILKPIITTPFPLVRFTADHTFPSYSHAPFIL
ncbi:UNVERIFIED_CONTAM: hypothetical protein FO487_14425 [Bacillus amyloliquefaciens DSM 7 = ATCC 23350]